MLTQLLYLQRLRQKSFSCRVYGDADKVLLHFDIFPPLRIVYQLLLCRDTSSLYFRKFCEWWWFVKCFREHGTISHTSASVDGIRLQTIVHLWSEVLKGSPNED
jgi:hypothetical protein